MELGYRLLLDFLCGGHGSHLFTLSFPPWLYAAVFVETNVEIIDLCSVDNVGCGVQRVFAQDWVMLTSGIGVQVLRNT